MGAPISKMETAEEQTAEGLLASFKQTAATERRKHATVFNYWQAIRRDRDLPAIRDLDPLEISDLAPSSLLLELVDGGEDAEIRHAGEMLRGDISAGRISEAPDPSMLSCIAGKIGIIAISRNALCFEDHFLGADGVTRCSVTLLPFSAGGDTVDFVYALVSLEHGVTFAEDADEPVEQLEPSVDEVEPVAEPATEEVAVGDGQPVDIETQPAEQPEVAEMQEPAADEPPAEAAEAVSAPDEIELPQFLTEPRPAAEAEPKPGFSKLFDALAGAKGFFGTVAPAPEPEPIAEEPAVEDAAEPQPTPEQAEPPIDEVEEPVVSVEPAERVAEPAEETAAHEEMHEPEPDHEEPSPIQADDIQEPRSMEGTLQSKLADVRSKADEARMAKLRAEAALIEGLSAAYDFALDAEDAPEEYLKLVEAQGLKIQLRSPMKPVVKLAFDGYCDGGTISDLEAVLAWALKSDLPRGTLAERLEAEGGIEAVLGPKRRAADRG